MSAPQTPSMRTLQSLPNRSFFYILKHVWDFVAASWRIVFCLLHIFCAIKVPLAYIKLERCSLLCLVLTCVIVAFVRFEVALLGFIAVQEHKFRTVQPKLTLTFGAL